MFEIIDILNCFFIIKFIYRKDTQKVFYEGHWLFGKYAMFLRKRDPNFDPHTQSIQKP